MGLGMVKPCLYSSVCTWNNAEPEAPAEVEGHEVVAEVDGERLLRLQVVVQDGRNEHQQACGEKRYSGVEFLRAQGSLV